MQEKSARMIAGSRKVLAFVLPIIVLVVVILIVYVAWILLRRW